MVAPRFLPKVLYLCSLDREIQVHNKMYTVVIDDLSWPEQQLLKKSITRFVTIEFVTEEPYEMEEFATKIQNDCIGSMGSLFRAYPTNEGRY